MAIIHGTSRLLQLPSDIFIDGANLLLNAKLQMDGRKMLAMVRDCAVPLVVFDPQYRGVMDKMHYGNEGARQKLRALLPQMDERTIGIFIDEIARVLVPSGHLFLWIDKYHLCEGISPWFAKTPLKVVDMVTWNKKRIGMGYRTRRVAEYLIILQKEPLRAKGIWKSHDIADVIDEKPCRSTRHAHPKPIGLQCRLIEAVTEQGDIILDPAAGSFSVLEAARKIGRSFLGCDIVLGNTNIADDCRFPLFIEPTI